LIEYSRTLQNFIELSRTISKITFLIENKE